MSGLTFWNCLEFRVTWQVRKKSRPSWSDRILDMFFFLYRYIYGIFLTREKSEMDDFLKNLFVKEKYGYPQKKNLQIILNISYFLFLKIAFLRGYRGGPPVSFLKSLLSCSCQNKQAKKFWLLINNMIDRILEQYTCSKHSENSFFVKISGRN